MIKDISAIQRGVIIKHDTLEYGGIVRSFDNMVVEIIVVFNLSKTGTEPFLDGEKSKLVMSRVLEAYSII